MAAPSPGSTTAGSMHPGPIAAGADDHFPIVALLPPNAETRFGEMRPVARAIEESEFYAEEGLAEAAAGRRKNTSEDVVEASIVTDGEIAAEALELMGREGKVRLGFKCECSLPFLVLQLKDIGRFCAVELTVESRAGAEYTIEMSSRASVARIGREKASLPLMIRPGWNYCCVDVEDVVHMAFGAHLAFTTGVTIKSSCRVARIFFQDKRYEDRELPPFLRVVR